MKNVLLSISFFLAIFNPLRAQENIESKIKELENQVSLLVKQDSLFRRTINIEDSLNYILTRNSIINAVDKAPALVFNFDKIVENIEKDALWTKIVDANNPSSNILGASFTDVVTKAAEKHFLQALDKKDKTRFTDIINKIVKNPIVSSVLSSNPVTSVVASITNAASDFFTNNITGAKVKDLEVHTKNVFDQNKLEAFNKELAPYIKFYDEMIKANDNYFNGLSRLKAKNKYLSENISSYNVKLIMSLGLDLSSSVPKSTQANNIFTLQKDKYGFIDYRAVLAKSEIKNTKEHSDKYVVYKIQVEDFQEEYNQLLKGYLEENIRLLTNAKSITLTKGFDSGKIDNLIIQIENFIRNNTSSHEMDFKIDDNKSMTEIFSIPSFSSKRFSVFE
nr:hypothetical protein [uncultured Draconibacterium sp.]